MPQETEIKLRIKDLKAFLRLLKRLGAKPAFVGIGRVHRVAAQHHRLGCGRLIMPDTSPL